MSGKLPSPRLRNRSSRPDIPSHAAVRGLCWLALLTSLLPENYAWSQIELPPVFAHNMVLQREQKNVIWGKGPPGQRIWMQFKDDKDLVWDGKIAKDGTWRGVLDLKKHPAEPGPGSLYLGLGKTRQQTLVELTNVVVGRVWLFAGWENKGIPANGEEAGERPPPPDRVRFITVRNMMELPNQVSAGSQAWEIWPSRAQEFNRFDKLSLLVGFALLNDKDYIGIIQTTVGSVAPAFLGRRSHTDVDLQIAWKLGSNAVWAAQAERQQKLIQLKRAGEVKELPPIYQYEMPSPCLRDSFPSDQPPASLLGFEGAIWPFED